MLNKIDEEAKKLIEDKNELRKETYQIISSIPVSDIVDDIKETLKGGNDYYKSFSMKLANDQTIDNKKDETVVSSCNDSKKQVEEKKISFFERLLNIL